MPEDLLQNLPVASAAGHLKTIEGLVGATVRELHRAVERLQGSARTFEDAWRGVVEDVARGRTAEMQAARPRLLAALEESLRHLKQAHGLARGYRNLGRDDLPDPDALLPEIIGLERLQARVFDLWQTADDLEDLAARDYPLTTADLDRIGPTCRPPAAYYAEEGKPF